MFRLNLANRNLFPQLALIFSIGFLTRFMWFFLPHAHPGGDYYHLAANLLKGHGLTMSSSPPYIPSTIRGPLYPLFIALIVKIFGDQPNIVFIMQALLSVFNCLLTFLLGRYLFNQKVGFWAGLIYALHPYPGLWDVVYAPESLCAFFLLCAFFFLAKWRQESKLQYLITSGILFACSALTRPDYLLLGGFVLPILILVKGLRQACRAFVPFLLVFSLAILPWTLRNYVATRLFIPIAEGQMGQLFFATTEPLYNQKLHPLQQSEVVHQKYPMLKQYFEAFFNTDPQAQNQIHSIEREFIRLGIENVKEHPIEYLLSRLKELPYLWIESGNYIVEPFLPGFSKYSWDVLLKDPGKDGKTVGILWLKAFTLFLVCLFPYSLAIGGVYVHRKEMNKIIFLLTIPLYITLIHIPFWIDYKYSLPGFPYVFILVGVGIASLSRCESSALG